MSNVKTANQVVQELLSLKCFQLEISNKEWKTAKNNFGTSAPWIGNGCNGVRSNLLLLYPDGTVAVKKVFNGPNNPSGTGNFNDPANAPKPAPNVTGVVIPGGDITEQQATAWVEQALIKMNCFELQVKGSDWKAAGSNVPSMGNITGRQGPFPELLLFYPDGAILSAQVFNGTDNPSGQGNFSTGAVPHVPSQVIAAIYDMN